MFCFVMKRRPPRSTLTYTLFPYTTRFRSAGLVWLTKLTTPLFEIFDLEVSWRDIILMGGGLFLLVKATSEIHGTVEGGHGSGHGGGKTTSFAAAIAQILDGAVDRSEEHTSELQSLMRISYAVFCLKKKKPTDNELLTPSHTQTTHRTNDTI